MIFKFNFKGWDLSKTKVEENKRNVCFAHLIFFQVYFVASQTSHLTFKINI